MSWSKKRFHFPVMHRNDATTELWGAGRCQKIYQMNDMVYLPRRIAFLLMHRKDASVERGGAVLYAMVHSPLRTSFPVAHRKDAAPETWGAARYRKIWGMDARVHLHRRMFLFAAYWRSQ